MKAARAFLERLALLGVEDCFLVPGGAIMHLVDELAQMQVLAPTCPSPKIRAWPMHDERAAAMAADGYARVKGKPALLMVSSGPGVLNALNGVWGAYIDSVPMIAVSGQVRSDTQGCSLGLRQLGDQELPTGPVVRQLVKVAMSGCSADTPDVAWQNAMGGRPGPVWIDWCVDHQAVDIDQREGDPAPLPPPTKPTRDQVSEALSMLSQAQRPVVIVGNGVPYHCPELRIFLDVTQVPLVTAFRHDQIAHDHSCWIGRQGTLGDRAGNLAAQRADLLLVIGCRMSIRNVTYDWDKFSPDSQRIHVDIDHAELRKPTFVADLPIQADSVEFLKALTPLVPTHRKFPFGDQHREWWKQCKQWRGNYLTTKKAVSKLRIDRLPQGGMTGVGTQVNVMEDRKHTDAGLDPYLFLSDLFAGLPDDVTIVTSDATAYIVSAQVSTGRHRQFSNSGCASMGYGIAAAIGAAVAGAKVLCVEGDGSIMQNLSCLASLAEFNLPVNVVVLCNGGYASIKATHKRIFSRPPLEPKALEREELTGIIGRMLYTSWLWASEDGTCYRGVGGIMDFSQPRVALVDLDPSIPIEPRLEARVVDGRIVTATLDHMTPEVSQ